MLFPAVASILSRRLNYFTPTAAFWVVWSLFKNGDMRSVCHSCQREWTSRNHSQVSFSNCTSSWKESVMCHFATRNWNTYTNRTTLLVLEQKHFWNVLQFRAVKKPLLQYCCSLLVLHKHAAMPKSWHIHDQKLEINNRFGDPGWTKASLFNYDSNSTIRA